MKKNVTPAVLAANRQNAAKSTGPTSTCGKLAVSRNALKHGLLAKKLRFRNKEEQAAFEELLSQLIQERNPQGVVECALTEEIVVCLWKIAEAAELENRDLRTRDRTTRVVLQAFADESEDQLPLSTRETQHKIRGLECKELTLRMGIADNEKFLRDEEEEKRARLLAGVRLGSSLEPPCDTPRR